MPVFFDIHRYLKDKTFPHSLGVPPPGDPVRVGLPYFHHHKGGHLFNEIYLQLVVLHRLYGKRQTRATIILAIRQSAITTSVRRIFERERPGNLRIMKTKKKSLRFSMFFCPNLDEDQKKRSSLRFLTHDSFTVYTTRLHEWTCFICMKCRKEERLDIF